MVPGNLPSQLEILSTGQIYYESIMQALPVACQDQIVQPLQETSVALYCQNLLCPL